GRDIGIATGAVARPLLHDAAAIERRRHLAVDLERRFVVFQCFVVVAGLEVCEGAAVDRVGIVGTQTQRLIAVGDRLIGLPGDRAHPAARVPRAGVLGPQPRDFVVIAYGGGPVAFLFVGEATIVHVGCVVGRELDRRGVVDDRLVEIALGLVGVAAVV